MEWTTCVGIRKRKHEVLYDVEGRNTTSPNLALHCGIWEEGCQNSFRV